MNIDSIRALTATIAVGAWLANKAHSQVSQVGVFQAARNLRKQGMPLELALLLLVGRQ